MAEELHFEIVMVLILQGSTYYLQLRNGKGQSGALGLIGCFGGKIEDGETAEEAACREVVEESNVQLTPEDLERLGEVNVGSEKHGKPATVHAQIYRAKVKDDYVVKAREGELVSMTLTDMASNLDRLTPATNACFKELLQKEK